MTGLGELWQLFWTFFRIGGLTFGGGYAILPMMQKEIVVRHRWATDEEMIDYYAVAQSMPGIIAINTATFLGFDRRGAPGAIAATLGMITPSIIVITVIASFIHHFEQLTVMQHAFAGVRIAVTALIIGTVVNMWRTAVTNRLGVALFAAALAAIFFVHVSPILVIAAGAVIGVGHGQWVKAKAMAAAKSEGVGEREGEGTGAGKSGGMSRAESQGESRGKSVGKGQEAGQGEGLKVEASSRVVEE